MSIKQILEGTLNNVLNREEALSSKRMEECMKCDLIIDTPFGYVCDYKMYINPKTKETSIVDRPGYVKGCGCILNSKTRVKEASCPGNKW
jgi:hypothetical protein